RAGGPRVGGSGLGGPAAAVAGRAAGAVSVGLAGQVRRGTGVARLRPAGGRPGAAPDGFRPFLRRGERLDNYGKGSVDVRALEGRADQRAVELGRLRGDRSLVRP